MRRSSRRNIVKSAAGYVVEALEGRTLLSFQANVNFQDAIASLPEGYLRDRGEVYANRIGGGTYGWDADNSANARNRDTEPDQRLDTFNHMQLGGANRSWSISVPNDTYRVRIVAGDPDNFNSVYKIAAEGVTVVDGTPDTNNRWITGTQTVTVTDGKLTITNAAGSSNNKICYIEIVDDSRLSSVPAVPTNVRALAETTTKINLTWTDNADNDTAYKVERSPNGTSGWTLFDRYSDATFFGDVTGLSANTTWYYRVRSANPAGFSAWSDIVQVTTPAATTQVPYNATQTPWTVGSVIEAENYDAGGEGVASHDVDATNSGGMYRVGNVDIIRYSAFAQVGTFVGFNEAGEWLEYTVNVPQNGTYRLEASVSNRDAGDGTFHMSIDGVDKTGLMTIPDTGAWTIFQTLTKSGISLTAGQHVLRVTIDSIGTNQTAAGNINWFNFVLTSASSTPTAPSNLTSVATSTTQVNLAWADNSSNETGFEVDRSTSSTFASGVTTVTLGADVTSYAATGLTASTTYYFRVRATNATGDSANSNTANATTLAANSTPAAPTSLTAIVATASQINLAWTDNSNNESGFEIDRSTSSTFASGVTTVTVATNVDSYAGTGLSANTTYYFRVRSTNSAGDSANSGTASARTATPTAPSSLSATTVSASQIQLTWTDNSSDETGFEIDRATNSGFTTDLLVSTDVTNSTSFTATGLDPSTTYWFRVRATNAIGDSANSSSSSATTSASAATPAAPTGLAAAVASATQVNLDWSDSSTTGARYNVYRGTTSSFTIGAGNQIATSLTTSRYVDAAVPSAGTYYYKITTLVNGVESSTATTAAQNTSATPPIPAAITNLSAEWNTSANNGRGAVILTWTDNSLGETRFVFTRTDLDGSTHTIYAPTNATTFTDVGPFPVSLGGFTALEMGGSTYTGQAQNGGGTSPATAPVGPVGPPVAGADDGTSPVIVSVTSGTTGAQATPTITWTDSNPATKGYSILQLGYVNGSFDYIWRTVHNVTVPNPAAAYKFTFPGLPLDGNQIYSFMVRANYEVGSRESSPSRIYTGAATDAKAVSLGWLNMYESTFNKQPYYKVVMRSTDKHPAIQGLFDQSALSLNSADVFINNSAPNPGKYNPITNNITFNFTGLPADEKGVTVIHESMHLFDDYRELTGYDPLSAFSEEAFAYSVEYFVKKLGGNAFSLNEFTTTTFANAAAAQTFWDKSWMRINATVGSNFVYVHNIYGDQSSNLTFTQVDDTLLKDVKCALSAATLLNVYNKILEKKGFPPNTLTNTFTFTLVATFN